ncbi:glycosyltransferase family 4 protein [Achromobacter dolens]|uniref:glycosyltransferase family 4 protein n=1 Tax=Achromobacter dolens TaxID=1287738 RepID=UPI0031D985FD
MNILLINHYAGSPRHGMEFRPYYLAREWIAQGHKVTIVASSVSHIRQRNPKFDGPTLAETLDGVDYLWLRTRPYQGNGAARLLNMLQFTGLLFRHAKALTARQPDVVIASSTYPYDIWPARHIARRAKAKLVYELHDVWPLTPQLLGGFSKWHPMIFSMQRAENYAYAHADKAVSLLPGTEDHMRAHGLRGDKFVYIPNGVDPGAAPTPVPEGIRAEIAQFREKFETLCIYAGGHAISNALDPLIEAAGRPQARRIGLVLVGSGVEKDRLQRKTQQLGLINVLFLDPVPKTAVPSLLAQGDMAYIGWRDSPLYTHGMSPNKLFDYMLAGLPVVHSTSSPYDIVQDANCGISVAAEDVDGIASALGRLASMPSAERRQLGENGRRFVQSRHSYPTLAARFLESLQPSPLGGRHEF